MTMLFLILAGATFLVMAASLMFIFPRGLSIGQQLQGIWIPLLVCGLFLYKALAGNEASDPAGWLVAVAGSLVVARFGWHMGQLRKELLQARQDREIAASNDANSN